MAENEIRIENSYETLSQDEWDHYLSAPYFNRMRIAPQALGVSEDDLPDLSHPRLVEMIREHNNKVGSVTITYALCRHYFDKGIPDDPWYISPGKQGQTVQYMPLFDTEHWMRRYWFSYFADTYYLKISSIWDSIIDLLNHYYQLDYPSDLRLRSQVFQWLKSNSPLLMDVFNSIAADSRYADAQRYRTAAAHGNSPSSVSNMVRTTKDEWVEMPVRGSDGTPMLDECRRIVTKRVKAKGISLTIGDYTPVATIMKNMEEFAVFSGEKIQEIMTLVRKL